MNEYLIQKETLDDIASAIQEKAAPAQDFTVADFGDLIRRIEIGSNDNAERDFYHNLILQNLTVVSADDLRNIPYIGRYILGNQSKMTSLTLPENMIEIRPYGCAANSKLIEVNFEGNNNINVGAYSFHQNTSLERVNNFLGSPINTDFTFGGAGCFNGCTKLDNINLPDRVNQLTNQCFQSCKALKNINLNYIQEIGDKTFNECISLETVDLSSLLTIVGGNSFANCTSLTKVILPDTPPSLYSINCFPVSNTGFKFHVSSAEVEAAYMAATNWSTYGSDVFTYPDKEEV